MFFRLRGLQSAHIVRQLRAVNGGCGLTADQYYLLKALVLANSDDLTLALSPSSSSAATLETTESVAATTTITTTERQHSNTTNNRTLLKGSTPARSAVHQFRSTIARALQTHLEMTAGTPPCCYCTSCCGNNTIHSTGGGEFGTSTSSKLIELLLCLPALRQVDQLIRQYWTRVHRDNQQEQEQLAAGVVQNQQNVAVLGVHHPGATATGYSWQSSVTGNRGSTSVKMNKLFVEMLEACLR